MSRPWYLWRFSKRCKASTARDPEEIDLPPLTVNRNRNRNRNKQKLVRQGNHDIRLEREKESISMTLMTFVLEGGKKALRSELLPTVHSGNHIVTFTAISYISSINTSIEKGVRDGTPEKNTTSNAH
jgi:hypothetical protein